MKCYIMPLRASLWHVSTAGEIACCKERGGRGSAWYPLLPQAGRERRTELAEGQRGRQTLADLSSMFLLASRKWFWSWDILKGKLIFSTSYHATAVPSLLGILVDTSQGLLCLHNRFAYASLSWCCYNWMMLLYTSYKIMTVILYYT